MERKFSQFAVGRSSECLLVANPPEIEGKTDKRSGTPFAPALAVLLGLGIVTGAVSAQIHYDREQLACEELRPVSRSDFDPFVAALHVEGSLSPKAGARVDSLESMYGKALKACTETDKWRLVFG